MAELKAAYSDTKATPAIRQRSRMRRRRRRSSEDAGFIYLLVFALLILGILSWRTSVFSTTVLLPTFVLAITARGRRKTMRLQIVGFANLAGAIPYIFDVYRTPLDYTRILAEPMTLMVIWGAAGLGYLLIVLAPMVAALMIQAFSQDRIKKLNEQRQQLIDQWGADVVRSEDISPAGQASTKPPT